MHAIFQDFIAICFLMQIKSNSTSCISYSLVYNVKNDLVQNFYNARAMFNRLFKVFNLRNSDFKLPNCKTGIYI